MTVSKYLAKLIQNDVSNDWPENYFDLFGAWEGEPIKRPEQGEPEIRDALK